MGKNISINSSNLMNKIFEIIEAKIFDLPYNKFDIIIHPQSLIHGMIKYKNGLMKFITLQIWLSLCQMQYLIIKF